MSAKTFSASSSSVVYLLGPTMGVTRPLASLEGVLFRVSRSESNADPEYRSVLHLALENIGISHIGLSRAVTAILHVRRGTPAYVQYSRLGLVSSKIGDGSNALKRCVDFRKVYNLVY